MAFLKLHLELDEIEILEFMRKKEIDRNSLIEKLTFVFRDELESSFDELDIK